jgi:hypothetical protein
MKVQVADAVRGPLAGLAEAGLVEVGAMHPWAGAPVLQAARPLAATERPSRIGFSSAAIRVQPRHAGHTR